MSDYVTLTKAVIWKILLFIRIRLKVGTLLVFAKNTSSTVECAVEELAEPELVIFEYLDGDSY